MKKVFIKAPVTFLEQFSLAGELFLQNDDGSVSNSHLGDALDGSDTDEDVTDNVFSAPGEEAGNPGR